MVKIINSRDDKRVLNIRLGKVDLDYTKHAQIRSQDKRIQLADSIQIEKGNVIEIEVNPYNKMTKAVVRLSYNNANDIIYVLVPSSNHGRLLVKTVWLNNKHDNHDISKYKTERAKSFQR